MKRSRFTENKIIQILKETDAGMSLTDLFTLAETLPAFAYVGNDKFKRRCDYAIPFIQFSFFAFA